MATGPWRIFPTQKVGPFARRHGRTGMRLRLEGGLEVREGGRKQRAPMRGRLAPVARDGGATRAPPPGVEPFLGICAARRVPKAAVPRDGGAKSSTCSCWRRRHCLHAVSRCPTPQPTGPSPSPTASLSSSPARGGNHHAARPHRRFCDARASPRTARLPMLRGNRCFACRQTAPKSRVVGTFCVRANIDSLPSTRSSATLSCGIAGVIRGAERATRSESESAAGGVSASKVLKCGALQMQQTKSKSTVVSSPCMKKPKMVTVVRQPIVGELATKVPVPSPGEASGIVGFHSETRSPSTDVYPK